MKTILFAASEGVPFVKTGGLADVVGSLPKYINKSSYDVRVVLPKYKIIPQEYKDKMKFLLSFEVDLGWRKQYVGVFQLKYEEVIFYFLDSEFYFSGHAPYTEHRWDMEKFAFFSKALVAMLPRISFQPDVIHCNDWQTGLVPIYLKMIQKSTVFYKKIKTIMTIHNLKFQGKLDAGSVRDITGVPDCFFVYDGLLDGKDGNYLKGGLSYCDYISTVSETYANEIKMPFFGENLDALLRSRSSVLKGIINGLDYDEFDPGTDPYITQKYSVEDFRLKKWKNKIALQRKLGLKEDKKIFMIGLVSRLTGQKGLDLVEGIFHEMTASNMQFVVLGTGEKKYEDLFRYYAGKHKDQISANTFYSEEFAHEIYAGADVFLMPSLFEPCGLSQLISLRYGTVPIVRETGGLKDTVEPYNEYEQKGTGFSFANYNAHEMLFTLYKSMEVFYTRKKWWNKIVERGMNVDYSWKSSAREYEKLYDLL